MDMDELPREERLRVFSDVMRVARDLGFSGFGGACWSAAVAINRLLFSSQGRYSMGVNAALLAAHLPVGHVAVALDDEAGGCIYLDADGRAKSEDEIVSWGMLDPLDVDWEEQAEGLGIAWGEEAAEGAVLLPASEQQLLGYAQEGLLQRQLSILERAVARVQPSASSTAPSLGMR